MGSQYAGNETNYPATIYVLDDTDPLDASSIAPSLQELADRTAFLTATMPLAVCFVLTQSVGSATIHAETSATAPCTLQTSAPHGFQTGMQLWISGATGDHTINGIWPIFVVDATHFQIPVAGAGGYTADSATAQWVVPAGCSSIAYDGWGGGGGGEGGASAANVDSTTVGTIYMNPPQGGGGAGARRCAGLLQTYGGESLAVTVGIGGAGGAGATGGIGTPAGLGASGSASTLSVGGSIAATLAGGAGAGAGMVENVVSPVQGSAVIARGGHDTNNPDVNRPWPFYAATYQANGTISNVGNFLPSEPGDGGAAVSVFGNGSISLANPSTGGIGQNGFPGAAAGPKGADGGSGPTLYVGGAGGGGGGSGPGGAGGAGGIGSNANGAGNSGPAGSGNGLSATNTGAGGGGGGTSGASSGTNGNGGNGGQGDNGQVTIAFEQTGAPF